MKDDWAYILHIYSRDIGNRIGTRKSLERWASVEVIYPGSC